MPARGATPRTPQQESGDLTAADFRHAIGHFATGVTVVTSVGPDGEPLGTTANAVSSLSLDPPLILVCFDRASVTLDAIAAHGAFAVNVLAARQQHLSANFARRGLAAASSAGSSTRGPSTARSTSLTPAPGQVLASSPARVRARLWVREPGRGFPTTVTICKLVTITSSRD